MKSVQLPANIRPRVPEVLLVSPPVVPPWRNGSVLIARDLACGSALFHHRVLGCRGQRSLSPRATVEPFYRDRRGTDLFSRVRLMARLCRPDRCVIHHFVFAPHKRVSLAAKAALTLSGKPSVHTIASRPRLDENLRALMFADRVVAVSESTAILLRSSGVSDVRVIRPAVMVPPPRDRQDYRDAVGADWGDEPVFLYAGDAEFSNGAQVFLDAAAELVKRRPKALFLLACRAKTPRSVTALRDLEHRARRLGVLDRTRFLGTVPDMPSLLGAVDAVVMPVNTLYAKVDTPYVLLEAMARQTPVIVSDLPALTELAGLGEGITVVKRDDSSAVAVAMAEVVSSASHRQWLGTLARRTVQAHFSSDTMIDAYETLYSELFHGS